MVSKTARLCELPANSDSQPPDIAAEKITETETE